MPRLITAFIAITILVIVAHGRILYVPTEYPTIQAGINSAVDGDTVLVADGTYIGTGNKNLTFGGKAIAVRSENGPESCIIDCQNSGRGVYFNSDEDTCSVFSGFTITHGYYWAGAGIYCVYSSPTISDCYLVENTATPD